MTDHNRFLNDMDFEKRLDEMGENLPSLVRFVARQQFTTNKILLSHDKRLTTLENRDRKFMGTIGGLGGAIGAGIVAGINYLFGKP